MSIEQRLTSQNIDAIFDSSRFTDTTDTYEYHVKSTLQNPDFFCKTVSTMVQELIKNPNLSGETRGHALDKQDVNIYVFTTTEMFKPEKTKFLNRIKDLVNAIVKGCEDTSLRMHFHQYCPQPVSVLTINSRNINNIGSLLYDKSEGDETEGKFFLFNDFVKLCLKERELDIDTMFKWKLHVIISDSIIEKDWNSFKEDIAECKDEYKDLRHYQNDMLFICVGDRDTQLRHFSF